MVAATFLIQQAIFVLCKKTYRLANYDNVKVGEKGDFYNCFFSALWTKQRHTGILSKILDCKLEVSGMERDITAKAGMTFEPFHFSIERGKIREFALALGDENPLYTSVEAAREAGFRDVPIPPTFPTVIEMWAGADFDELIRVLELDPLKVLHGEQEYEYVQDICAGDDITGQSRVVSAVTKRGMNLFTIETTFKNQLDEQVLLARSLLIERP